MPTKKPKLQVILDQEDYDLLKEISEKDMRSMSQMGGIVIKRYLEEYKKSLRKNGLERSSESRTG